MKTLIAIELILGAIVVVAFWFKNPELVLSRYSSHALLDPCDDEWADDAEAQMSWQMALLQHE